MLKQITPGKLNFMFKCLVRELQTDNPRPTAEFSIHTFPPTEDTIRSLRPANKRRSHIYNYERDRAANLWVARVNYRRDIEQALFMQVDKAAGTIHINANFHPILIKGAKAALAQLWPEVKLEVVKGWGHPLYDWSEEAEKRRNLLHFTYSTTYPTFLVEEDLRDD